MQIPGRKIFQGETFLTDWQPRGGDGFILRAENIGDTGIDVAIEILTKNSEETGDGLPITSNGTNPYQLVLTAASSGIKELIVEPSADANEGVEELVRLKVSTSGGSSSDWMLCRTFPLVWFEGVR